MNIKDKKWEDLTHRQKRKKIDSARGCGGENAYKPWSWESTIFFSGVFIILIILVIIGIK